MSMTLLFALVLQSAPVVTKLNVAEPVDCVVTPRALGCPERRNERFRLGDSDEPAFDRKADGLKQDGRQCGLLGSQQYCTRKPRTILSAPTN
ncbi:MULTISPECIES: hypothetical protein [unclassified Sphingomonas]|uniref:hypothetical protein n=1 Tax=unclassified Sphingomonas TaxID=196159 RepID=UPI0012E26B30|nr:MULTISPECIES: hypothetical protein [unclassified Sphingomonas]